MYNVDLYIEGIHSYIHYTAIHTMDKCLKLSFTVHKDQRRTFDIKSRHGSYNNNFYCE